MESLVTASLFRSPGLFSVFWPILTILQFRWSPFTLLFPSNGVFSDSKSLQVSRTLLSILADINKVSTRLIIFKSFSPFTNPLVTVPRAPITTGIFVTFMFHCFFYFPGKVQVLILFFAFFQFSPVFCRDSKVDNSENSITESLLSDGLVSCQGHSLGKSYLSVEMQSVYLPA